MNNQGVTEHIVNWLGEYAKAAQSKGFVVGVSGGIDSAVTSTLAAKTGLKVICLEMPIHQEASQAGRARLHIESLEKRFENVHGERIDLSKVFDSFVGALPDSLNTEPSELALANSRARLRMSTLYYAAGTNNCLVAGTGNKIEDFGVGFYTKYGDGGVDISPIADLVKSEVYQLGAVLGVMDEIMRAKPTDGLWDDDRSDEDQLGASYAELEWAMEHIEEGPPGGHVTARQAQVLDIFRHLNRVNRHKMTPIPVCEIPARLRE